MYTKKIVIFILLSICMGGRAQETIPVINVSFSDETATVTVPDEVTDVTASIIGANVTLVSDTEDHEYCYHVTGSTSNGKLLIQGDYKLTLQLDGVSITNTAGAALTVSCGKRIAVELCDGTVNTLVDAAGGSQKAAMYFSGHPEFQGGGTLNVTGNTAHAIGAKEYLEIKSGTGAINILGAIKDGIHCGKGKVNNENNYFEINGGTVNISNVGGDCIDSDDYGTMKIKGGKLNLIVSAEGGTGLKCDSIFTMKDDAEVNITLTATDAEGIRCNHTANFKDGDLIIVNSGAGSKGIKVKNETTGTVLGGGFANFNGTNVDIELTGSTLTTATDTNRCIGISVDQNMTLTDNDFTVHRNANEVKSHNVKGTLTISDEGRMILEGNHYTPVTTYQNQMVLYARGKLDGTMLDDYANYQLAAYVGSECRGKADIMMVKDGYIYCYLPVSGTTEEAIAYHLYDASEDKEYASHEVSALTDNSTWGTPSAPQTLSFGAWTIGDLVRVIDVLKGNISGIHANADINHDDNANKQDVIDLLDILLKMTSK